MNLSSFETMEEANCVAAAIQGTENEYFYSLKLKEKLVLDPLNLDKIMPGTFMLFRLFGTNKDNPNFPVWCPERSPVDMMLFYPLFYVPEFDAIAVTIFGTHPIPPPLFSVFEKTVPANFICEDPD